jgi:hypothetical protein
LLRYTNFSGPSRCIDLGGTASAAALRTNLIDANRATFDRKSGEFRTDEGRGSE